MRSGSTSSSRYLRPNASASSSTISSTFGTSRRRDAIASSSPARRSSTSKSRTPSTSPAPRSTSAGTARSTMTSGRSLAAASSPRRRTSCATTGASDDVAATAMSAAASASSRLVEAERSRAEPRADLLGAFPRPVRDAMRAIRRPSAAFSVCSPIRPAPITRSCCCRRSPSTPSASASAIELAVAGFAPIAVSDRARRPAVIAVRKSSVSAGPAVPAELAASNASPTWPRISASPSTSESSPVATRHRWRAASSPAWT